MIIYSIFEIGPMLFRGCDRSSELSYVCIVPSVTEAAMSKLAAIFQFYFDSLSPNTASYSLQYP